MTAVVETSDQPVDVVRPDVDRAADVRRPVTARGAGSDRYLAFVLGGDVYAVDILDVTEIMEFRNLTVVPMVPEFIRGVINLRGSVVPVVDLALRFGKRPTQVARRTSILIVETSGPDGAGQHIGIMVDTVDKVLNFGAAEIEPPPAFGAGIRTDFISGMARHDGEFVIILDVERVLSLSDLQLVTQVATSITPADVTE